MKYRPNDQKYLTNGVPDEDKVLVDLLDINDKIIQYNNKLGSIYTELTEAQKAITLAVTMSRNGQYTKDFNKILKDIMWLKEGINNLYDTNIYPLMFFIDHANHLRTLKKSINQDEYLKEKWNEIMLYMRMKDK